MMILKRCQQVWLFVALALINSATSPNGVLAQGNEVIVFDVRQSDLDGDGLPDVTVIESSFASTMDRVSVYDGGNDMQWSNEWTEATDFANDVWVFDVAKDDTAQLIVRFLHEDGCAVALFYDDQDYDGDVAYEFSGGTVRILESRNWTLKVESDSTWFLADGYPNQNLRFTRQSSLDYWSEVVDENHDGVPDREVWNLIADTAEVESTAIKSGTWVNLGNSRPLESAGRVFWPFLLGSESLKELQAGNKFSTVAFVAVDWWQATIAETSVGWVNSGYPIENGYFISGPNSWRENQINLASFENPMAYYDIALDRDGFPEMHIRHQYHPPFDRWYYYQLPEAVNEIRYSWNQQNRTGLTFDYKLGLAGTYEVDDTVLLSNFGLKAVPYNNLPTWVTSREWPLATFFEYAGGYNSSEGIYDWFPWAGTDPTSDLPAGYDLTQLVKEGVLYLVGQGENSPISNFTGVRRGGRGEYRFGSSRLPLLYLSPIDGKLHLLYAEGGIWNIDGLSQIRVANLDRDAYLDQWTLTERSAIDVQRIAQLNIAPTHLLYAGESEIVIKESSIEHSLFETLPPTDHTDWVELGNKIAENERAYAPNDFLAALAQFPGPEMHLTGAHLRDYRRIEGDGFRFILDILPGYRVQGVDLLGLSRHEPGEYAVIFVKGEFLVATLTAPDLALDLTVPEDAAAGAVQQLLLEISNTGLQDVDSLAFVATVEHKGERAELDRREIDVLSGQPTRIRLDWQPESEGDWQLNLTLKDAQGEVLAEQTHSLEVGRPNPRFTAQVPASAGRFGPLYAWLPVLAILASVAGLAAVAGQRSDDARVR